MKNFLTNQWWKITLIVIALGATAIIAWYFIISLPRHNQTKAEVQIEQWKAEQDAKTKAENNKVINQLMMDEIRRNGLLKCTQEADMNYSGNWDNECAGLGLPDNCMLPVDSSDHWDDVSNQEKDNCKDLWK